MRRALRTLLLLAAAGAFGAILLVALVWRDRHSPVSLPAPSGPFAVGRVIDVWVDHTGRDPLAPPGARRELVAWIWYPADPSVAAAPADYRPAYWRDAMAREQMWLLALLWHDPAWCARTASTTRPCHPPNPPTPSSSSAAGWGRPRTEGHSKGG